MDYSIDSLFNTDNNYWDVTISGEVDIFSSQELKIYLVGLLEQKEANIYIDCANLYYMDSTALGALVGVLKNVKACGFNMYLRNVKPNLQKIFKITNLDKVFILEEGDTDE